MVVGLAAVAGAEPVTPEASRLDRSADPASSYALPDRPNPGLAALPDWVNAATPAAGGVAPPPEGDVLIAPPPDAFDAPAEPTAPPPGLLQAAGFEGVNPAGGVWAVVIGVNDYPGSRSDLRSAVNDANDADEALARYGIPGDRRLVLRDRQASAATILRAMDWLVAHAGPDATAVVFYAGHVRKLASHTEAVVAADGRLVTDAQLADRLRPLAARRTWVTIAACYGGGFTELLAPGRILTAAASANALAYENQSFGRSYLGQYMVRLAMIEGRAAASVEQSFAWAADALRRDYPNRVPVQYDHVDGELSLGSNVAAAPPPSGSGGAPAPPPEQSPPPAPEPQPGPRPDDGRECLVRIGGLATSCRES